MSNEEAVALDRRITEQVMEAAESFLERIVKLERRVLALEHDRLQQSHILSGTFETRREDQP